LQYGLWVDIIPPQIHINISLEGEMIKRQRLYVFIGVLLILVLSTGCVRITIQPGARERSNGWGLGALAEAFLRMQADAQNSDHVMIWGVIIAVLYSVRLMSGVYFVTPTYRSPIIFLVLMGLGFIFHYAVPEGSKLWYLALDSILFLCGGFLVFFPGIDTGVAWVYKKVFRR
jgi:hypothetical protein